MSDRAHEHAHARAHDAPAEHKAAAPSRLVFAIVTASDSRSAGTDASGDLLERLAREAGHDVTRRDHVRDDADAIRGAVEAALAGPAQVVLVTGGTGVAPRDVTPEAVRPLLEKELPGFGELFRMLSWQEVGSAALASRAFAGVARGRLVFALPGSPKACRLAMERLVLPEAPHLAGLLAR